MIVNWILLLLTAFVAYVFGSLSTQRVASRYVFHRSLEKLGKGNVWLSNFRRLFGLLGFLKLALVEILKDLLPILFGALLLSFRERPDIGRAFAGFCLMMGRLWPVFNRYRGCHGSVALIVAAFAIDGSVGATAALAVIVCTWLGKTYSFGALGGAVAMAAVSVMVVENNLILILSALIALLVVLRHIPAIVRILRRQEEIISLEQDITYKFDEKF
jgi:glycerol-3-phosphate acyltransferase PlsY